MKEFKNRLHKKYLFQYMCMYRNALNVEEGALDRLAECPDQSAPYRGPLPGGLYQRASTAGVPLEGPPEGPHQRHPSEPLNQGPQ